VYWENEFCYRYPPNEQYKISIENGYVENNGGLWVETLSDEWCGEHPDFPAYLESLKEVSNEKTDV
jgi:hypothetical protein